MSCHEARELPALARNPELGSDISLPWVSMATISASYVHMEQAWCPESVHIIYFPAYSTYFFFLNKHINIQLHFFKRCSTCHSFLMPENSCPPCATFWSSYPLLLGASASAGLAEDTTLALFHSLNSHRLSNTVYWTQLLGLRFIPPQDDGFPFTTDKKQNTK